MTTATASRLAIDPGRRHRAARRRTPRQCSAARRRPSIVAIALAYPDALVDGFDGDARAHRRGPRPRPPPCA